MVMFAKEDKTEDSCNLSSAMMSDDTNTFTSDKKNSSQHVSGVLVKTKTTPLKKEQSSDSTLNSRR
jgi:hypothetical protein